MPTAEKAMKEIHNEMPVAKKERTDHKCLWQRKKDQTLSSNELTLMLRLSQAHMGSEHFAECDFLKLYSAIPNVSASKRNL